MFLKWTARIKDDVKTGDTLSPGALGRLEVRSEGRGALGRLEVRSEGRGGLGG